MTRRSMGSGVVLQSAKVWQVMAGALLAVVLSGASAEQAEPRAAEPETQSLNAAEMAAAVWQAIGEARLTGEGAIHAAPYVGKPPHGDYLETLSAIIPFAGEERPLILLRGYSGKQINRMAVASQPEKWLKDVSVMVKVPNYAPQHNDWFWVRFDAAGKVSTNAKGVLEMGTKGGEACFDCHVTAAGGDLVFNHDRFAD